MTFNAMTERYEEITVCGKPALFTSIRIKRDTVPDGLYAYDVRHDDECRGIPCEIAPFIMVNHWGTIILAEPLELPDDGRRYIDEEMDWNYLDIIAVAEVNVASGKDNSRKKKYLDDLKKTARVNHPGFCIRKLGWLLLKRENKR